MVVGTFLTLLVLCVYALKHGIIVLLCIPYFAYFSYCQLLCVTQCEVLRGRRRYLVIRRSVVSMQ